MSMLRVKLGAQVNTDAGPHGVEVVVPDDLRSAVLSNWQVARRDSHGVYILLCQISGLERDEEAKSLSADLLSHVYIPRDSFQGFFEALQTHYDALAADGEAEASQEALS